MTLATGRELVRRYRNEPTWIASAQPHPSIYIRQCVNFSHFLRVLIMLLACILGLSTIAAVPADVEDTACGYRVEIYAQFHGDREEYDCRRETADALLRAWKQRGQMADDSAELAGWYEDAREALRNGQSEPVTPVALDAHVRNEYSDEQLDVTNLPSDDQPGTLDEYRLPTILESDGSAEWDEVAPNEEKDGGALSGLGRVFRSWTGQ
jgi:hypothetical protein